MPTYLDRTDKSSGDSWLKSWQLPGTGHKLQKQKSLRFAAHAMYYGPRQRGTVKHGGSVGLESKVETWKDWMVTFLEDSSNLKMGGLKI